MILRVGIISRRPDLDPAVFAEHWLVVHGGLAKRMPGLHSYRQNHILERLYEAKPSPIQQVDGFSQLRFDDLAAMEVSERSPEYAAVRDDIANFQGGITILVVSPEDIFAQRDQSGVKLLWISRLRAATQDLRAQQRAWADRTRDLTADFEGVRKIVQNWVVDKDHPVTAGVPSGAPDIDALSEIWFDDRECLMRALATEQGHALIHENEAFEPLGVYLVNEVVMV